MLLQTGDGFAHSGLADVQLSCGGGDIATLSYCIENVIEIKLIHDLGSFLLRRDTLNAEHFTHYIITDIYSKQKYYIFLEYLSR